MDIQLRGLAKSFGERRLFHNLNLTFAAGEITLLVGESGAGKTTLLNILMGLTDFDSGEILGLPGRQSALFQENRLIPFLSAAKNIALACQVSRDLAAAHLSRLGLTDIDSPARSLSGGMARRVAIARACLAPSEIIFMDEPFSGLDKENVLRVTEYIRLERRGRTLIAAVHDPEEGRELGGMAVVLRPAML